MLYDPTTDTYHLHYQWHPNHVNWGNISWGFVKLYNLDYAMLMELATPHLRIW